MKFCKNTAEENTASRIFSRGWGPFLTSILNEGNSGEKLAKNNSVHTHQMKIFSLRRSGFDPKLGHMGFVMENVVLGFSEYHGFPCQFSFHKLLHAH
jgi:hypothetical protein